MFAVKPKVALCLLYLSLFSRASPALPHFSHPTDPHPTPHHSDDTTKPQLALSFFKEREQGKGNRKAHLSASQLSHLVALTPSFETKKSLVLLLAPYVCPDASNYKAIVELFPSAPDVSSIIVPLLTPASLSLR